MLLQICQWIIDTIGKLGPLAVAIAVFVSTKRQQAWANAALVRSSAVDDQRLRLAMLEKRLIVIQHLKTARDRLSPNPSNSDSMGAALLALNDAELIYEDKERLLLNDCLGLIVRFQNRYMGRFNELDGAELDEAVIEYSGCLEGIANVLNHLRAATRVQDVAPLVAPK